QATQQGLGLISGSRGEKKEPFLPAIYYALVDGAWYASLQEQPVKDMIDRSEARQKQPAAANAAEVRQVNSALYVAPEAAVATKEFARGFLAREAHRRALVNAPAWYAFATAAPLEAKSGEGARQDVLYRSLGYVLVL